MTIPAEEPEISFVDRMEFVYDGSSEVEVRLLPDGQREFNVKLVARRTDRPRQLSVVLRPDAARALATDLLIYARAAEQGGVL